MGFKYQGDATLGVSLTMQTPKPLDARLVVDTRQDLYSIPSNYAYNGMAVACVADGNIYTLLDKNKITETIGWKASYESVQIVTCTETEYNTWKNNTNDDYTPKDDTVTWLHQDIYYYIYEESISDKGQYYVSYTQFAELENKVEKRALITDLESLASKTTKSIADLANVYATLDDIDSTNADSKLSKTLDNYYTKTQTDDTFVTKDSLRGDGIEGDDFVFVTQTQYDKDQAGLTSYKEEVKSELDTKVKTNSDAQLSSVITEGNKLVIGEQATLNNKALAFDADVPKIVVMDQQEYEELENKEEDVYYMTHGTEANNGGMVTSSFLESNYYSQAQVIDLINLAFDNLFAVSGETLQLGTQALSTILVDKPTNQTFEYDGEVHTLESTDGYDVTGTGGSEPGKYRFKVVLKASKRWKDNTNTPIFVTYIIKDKYSVFGDTFPIKLS